MATPTYDLLDSVTLSTVGTSITFSNINQGYRDLVLVASIEADAYDSWTGLRFNGVAGDYRNLFTSNASVSYTSATEIRCYGLQNTNRGTLIAHIIDYAKTDRNKGVIGTGGSLSVGMYSGRFTSNAAVTSLTLFGGQGLEWAAGTTVSIYGIAG